MFRRAILLFAITALIGCSSVDLRVRDFNYTGGMVVTAGAPIGSNIVLEVENSGDGTAGANRAGIYLSEDATITSADMPLTSGEAGVPPISGGSTATVSVPSAATIPEASRPGSAFLGVIVDTANIIRESAEGNNTAAIPITVSHPTVPVQTQYNFEIDGPDAVPFQLFNVLVGGQIEAEIEWTGAADTITVELTGRRRDTLPDPTTPYASVTGHSPLVLNYTVTANDLERGVGWRLAIRDASGTHQARGTLRLTVPANAAVKALFERQRIELKSGDLWPSSTLQARFVSDLTGSSLPHRHAIVTLKKACDCQQNRRLEKMGIHRYSYLPGRNSFASIERGTDFSAPFVDTAVRFVTPLDPEDKIDPYLLLGDYRRYRVLEGGTTPANRVLNADGTLSVTVLFSPAADRSDIQGLLSPISAGFVAQSDTEYQVTLDPGRLRQVAEADFVEWIAPGPALPMPDLNVTRQTINANPVQNANINAAANTIAYAGLSGNGVNAGVQDTNIDATHPDLNVVATVAPAAAGSHGTHVAGILAGSGVQSALNDIAGNPNGGAAFQWRGVAPQAGLIASGDLDNGGNLNNAINNQSLDVTNRSQSITYDGNYDAENRRIDQQIRGGARSGGNVIPRRQLIVSAGNHAVQPTNQRPGSPGPGVAVNAAGQTGYFSITKQMKNAMVVGNWNAGGNRLAAGSSLGPAYDGRLKPEVVAPGTQVVSTGTVADGSCSNAPNLSNGYTGCSGTSMAAPAVTGSAALLLQAWQNTYNTPAGLALDDNPPLPSTLRALLAQTATDIVNNNVRGANSPDVDFDNNPANGNDGLGNVTATAGPDYATGFGLINVQAAVNLLQDNRTVDGAPVPNRMIQAAVNQGNTVVYDFVLDQPTIDQAVANGTPALQVTLAWDDVEASSANPATKPMLVNDIDLELTAPDGTAFYPWQLGHTNQDGAGNPLADNAQPPGTTVQPVVPIAPINNANFGWVGCVPGAAGCNNAGIVAGAGPINVDYVPRDAIDGDGNNDTWVAGVGKDHLNNIEQVSLQPAAVAGLTGHWQLRVIGFNVQTDAQDFSAVGFPYPDLPELVATSDDKVGFPAFGTAVSFDWTIQNVGEATTGTGTFDYQVLLSTDFALGGDVALTDTHPTAGAVGPVNSGASVNRTSTITITQANAATLLGDPGATLQDLIDADAFILVHVDSNDDILEHNEGNNLVAVQLARLSDVVFVMDRSGSMSGDVPVGAGTRTKLSILQSSATLFLDLLRKDAGDRLGLVSFSNNSSILFDDGAGSVQDFGAATTGAAQTAIDGLTADGSTNIRDALQDGLDLIPAGGGRRKVIVFLSDGMRTAGGDPAEATFLQQFDANDIKVFSVGFGTEGGSGYAGIDIDLLEQLTNVGDQGFFLVTSTATGLDKFFVNAVAGAVDAEVILDPVGTLDPAAGHRIDIPVNSRDGEVTFVLTWEDPAASLSLSLRSPEGTVIGPGNLGSFASSVRRNNGTTFEVLTVAMPVVAGGNESHAGQWQMIIANPSGNAVRYSASAYAETTLRTDFAIAPPAGAVYDPGDSIAVTTRVFVDGAGIRDADVVMRTTRPLVGIGDVLSATGLLQAEIAAVPSMINGETLTLRERMVAALWRRLGHDPIPLVEGPALTLAETGTPGVYQGVYPRLMTPGPYLFVTRIESITADCDPVMREEASGAGISDRTSRGNTGIVVSQPGGGSGTVTVTVTPRHGGGGLIGPGFGDAFVFETRGLSQERPVADLLNGSYQIDFRATGNGIARLSMTFRGVALEPQSIDLTGGVTVEVTPPGGGTPGVVVVAGTTPTVSPSVALAGTDGTIVRLQQIGGGEGSTRRYAIPAGLTPGIYGVLVAGRSGMLPIRGTTRTVIGRDALISTIGRLIDGTADAAVVDVPQSLEVLGMLSDQVQDAPPKSQVIDEFLRMLQMSGEERRKPAVLLPKLLRRP